MYASKRKRRERAIERSLSVFNAALLVVSLFILTAVPENTSRMVSAILLGDTATEPAPTPDANVFIRLANVDDDVGSDIIIKLMNIKGGTSVTLTGDEPRILIYHSHDTEAYRETPDSTYVPSGSWRTEDDTKNVIAVGEELARILREDYGIAVVHATEKHEKPNLMTAYSRSLETMLYYKKMYPSIEMFIDVHRDGVAETGFENDFVTVDGLECARMMFVVGTGKSGKTSQYAPEPSTEAEKAMPDFESNYALAVRLTETLLSYNPRFMRSVNVKSGKYNQQVSSQCLLVEIGHNANTLEQAMNSVKYLARAIAELNKRDK